MFRIRVESPLTKSRFVDAVHDDDQTVEPEGGEDIAEPVEHRIPHVLTVVRRQDRGLSVFARHEF